MAQVPYRVFPYKTGLLQNCHRNQSEVTYAMISEFSHGKSALCALRSLCPSRRARPPNPYQPTRIHLSWLLSRARRAQGRSNNYILLLKYEISHYYSSIKILIFAQSFQISLSNLPLEWIVSPCRQAMLCPSREGGWAGAADAESCLWESGKM